MLPTLTPTDLLAPHHARLRAAAAERGLAIGAWADEHLTLPHGGEMRRHDQAKAPYWRPWLARARARILNESITADPTALQVDDIFLCAGAQTGKTNGFLVPLLTWTIACHPRNCGVVLPSDEQVKRWAKHRLMTIVRNSPRLDALLPTGQAAREKSTGARAWFLDACHLFFLNGAVALDLRSQDLPLVLLDEFDALPSNVDGEGDPLALLKKRQETFPGERLLVGISTPTLTDALAWHTLCTGSHERLMIACPACVSHQVLHHTHLIATDATASPDAIVQGDLAAWACPACGALARTREIRAAIAAASVDLVPGPAGGWVPGTWEETTDGPGRWTPSATFDAAGRLATIAPLTGSRRTGWLSAMYSYFVSLGQFLAWERSWDHYTDAERQAHANNNRCEPWRSTVDAISLDQIITLTDAERNRGATYHHGQCPEIPWRLVLSSDQQGALWDRSTFPWILRAYQRDGASWLVDCGQAASIAELEILTQRSWPCGGQSRRVDLTTLDSANGVLVREIRTWCAREPRARLALSGSASLAPDAAYILTEASPKNQQRLCGLPFVFTYNAHWFRDRLYDRIRGLPGTPAWHVAHNAPDYYRASLTAEERLLRDVTIRGRREQRPVWQKRTWTDHRGVLHTRDDNHWWDCETQSLAATTCLGWWKPQAPPRPTGVVGRVGVTA